MWKENILASGSITSSSAIINGVNIGSGLTSLQTQLDTKQNSLILTSNIITGTIESGTITGRSETTITAPTIKASSTLLYGNNINVATKYQVLKQV